MYNVNDKVITQNMDGQYNNVSGKIIMIHPDIDTEMVYTVEYDIPFGSCTRGMFKESDLKCDRNMNGIDRSVLTKRLFEFEGKACRKQSLIEEYARQLTENKNIDIKQAITDLILDYDYLIKNSYVNNPIESE